MIAAKVIGRMVSTRKHENLTGSKLLVVEVLNAQQSNNRIIAVDVVGAGISDYVLITTGSSARIACYNENCPVDAVIVGILDDENDFTTILES
jgi:microcompartment protein CcmK/EutM